MSVTAGRVTDHVTVGTAVQITAAVVLLQEGVEGGEDLGHGGETNMGPSWRLAPSGECRALWRDGPDGHKA